MSGRPSIQRALGAAEIKLRSARNLALDVHVGLSGADTRVSLTSSSPDPEGLRIVTRALTSLIREKGMPNAI